uniref:Uncharacterized protein n=1 Tax=viral metagenome TaxID=1070528 RepID=A0A6C0C3N0_9ZZZZ
MSKLSLTRYLYFLEEIKITFIETLLKKNSLKECYFWISEIYYSGFKKECWDLLIKIYYDFYYLSNKKLVNKLKIKYKKRNEIKTIYEFINILYHSNSCPYMFIARTTMKGRRNIKDIDETIKSTLKKAQVSRAAFYINILVKSHPERCVEIVENFTKKSFVKYNFIDNDFTLFQALLGFSSKEYNQPKRNLCSKTSKENLNYIAKINTKCDRTYNTLKERRLLDISPNINCFKLGTNENGFDKIYSWAYGWEYLTKDTPIWKSRYDKYNASFKKKNIIFEKEDDMDEFYNLYNYEPDELLLLFIKDINDNTIENWLNSIYDTSFENLYKGLIDY